MALTSTEEALVRQLLDQQVAILSLAGNESTITSKLGATKVTLDDLVAASSVNNADLFLTRQGVTDKSVTAAVLKTMFGGNFVQQGTGAVERASQDKMREVISVKDFGAVGDGVADDTSAIQAALNSLSEYSTLWLPSGVYLVSNTITIPTNNICLHGKATIKAADATTFEFVLLGTSRTGVVVKDLHIDANKAGRESVQTVRFMGAAFISSTDCEFNNVTASGALGYNSIPGVGLTIAGASIRGQILGCTVYNCGDNTGLKGADAYFTSGEQNLIIGCVARNCTDTGFVIESSNHSVISGCTSMFCNAVAAITNASADTARGNIISNVTGLNWDASNTGGIQIGVPNTATGNLIDSVVAGVSLFAETASYGTGAAINIRQQGFGRAIGVTISDVRIQGASTQGILVDGDEVLISNCSIEGTGASCIQFQNGTVGGIANSNRLKGGSYAIVTNGNAEATAQLNMCKSQSSYGTYAFSTSILNSVFNTILLPGAGYEGKDVGANLNMIGHRGVGAPAFTQVTNSAPSGSLSKKITAYDNTGTPIGVIPIYST